MTTKNTIDVTNTKDKVETNSLPLPLLIDFVGAHKLLWDSRDQGDCRLIISYPKSSNDVAQAVKQDNGKVLVVEAGKSPCTATSIMCHTSMLISHSDYFRKRLLSARTTAATPNTGSESAQLIFIDDFKDGIFCLKEQLAGEADLPVLEAMIKFFYVAEIDPALSLDQLLSLIELADRYAATICRAASLHVLSTKLAASMTEDDINSICNFQPTNREGWKAIEDIVYKYLMAEFGVADRSYKFQHVRERWAKLTWNAARLVLCSDALEVDCEETVACLVGWWMKRAQEMMDRSSKHFTEVIADIETNVLRFGCFALPFCSGYLKESWLNLALTHQHEIYQMIGAPKGVPIRWDSKLPSLWYTTRSKASEPRKFTCSVQIREADFREKLHSSLSNSEDQKFVQCGYYMKGWWLTLQLCVSSGSVNVKIHAFTQFQESKVLVDTRVVLGNSDIIVIPALDTTVSDAENFTQLACIMEADVAASPGTWHARRYFQNGKMQITATIESIH